MKKKIILGVIIGILLIVLVPYIKNDILTFKYGEMFKNGYKETGMIDVVDYYKVFSYSENEAKVFYVCDGHETGNFIYFKKVNGKWKMKDYDCIWSKTGSASGFTFPLYY